VVHPPDLIAREKVRFIPEPDPVHTRGSPLFVNPEDVMYHNKPTLHYWVAIRILEIIDWHVPASPSLGQRGLV
jgi:hypothetical protein